MQIALKKEEKKNIVFVIFFLDPNCCDSGNVGDDQKNDLCFLFLSLPSSAALLSICVDSELLLKFCAAQISLPNGLPPRHEECRT